MPPRFSSFDEAWQWFEAGGDLVSLAQQRSEMLAGRAQVLFFHVRMLDEAVWDAAQDVLDALGDIADPAALQAMDPDHLHVSILPVGFQVIAKRRDDELLPREVDAIARRASKIVKRVKRGRVRVGPVNVFPDALILEVRDDDGTLAALRQALISELGREDPGADVMPFLPHITIAWFESADVAGELRRRLPKLRVWPQVETEIRRLELARWWFTGLEETEPPELDVVREYALKR